MRAQDLNLTELMDFSKGVVSLHGRRLVIHDLPSLAQFRRDLIEMAGKDQARRILTRKGLFWGRVDAAAMQRLFQWDSIEEWLKAAPVLNAIAGMAEAEMQIVRLDKENISFEARVIWKKSVEAEEYLSEIGKSNDPACWVLVGYASGYASYCLNKSIYFVEEQCAATGASHCIAVGRDIDSWGKKIEPFLPFFKADDITRRVGELTGKIRKQQADLAKRRDQGRMIQPPVTFMSIDVRSPSFAHTVDLAARVAKFDTTVMITGETGSGKELLARYIHRCSPRAEKPFIAINCSALPDQLLESELFGHRAGAFTGATRDMVGLFEEAQEGTIFLDEIGDVSTTMQAKLLRVLQEKEIKRVGDSKVRKVDVRILSATNRDLAAMAKEGKFRDDLLYRLRVMQINVPALRDRREDILPLARYFLKRIGRKYNLTKLQLAPACLDVLLKYSWPGNVRELEHALEHAAVTSTDGLIMLDMLPASIIQSRPLFPDDSSSRSLADIEQEYIKSVLERTHGKRLEAARILGIGEATLYRKLRQFSK